LFCLFLGGNFVIYILISQKFEALLLICLKIILLFLSLFTSIFFWLFLHDIWWFFLNSWTLRDSFLNIILNFVQNFWISFYTVLMIIDIILLCLAFPRMFANHVQICFSRFYELLIFFKGMLLKSIASPRQQLEHTWIFFAISGRFSKDIRREVYFKRMIFCKMIVCIALHFRNDWLYFDLIKISK